MPHASDPFSKMLRRSLRRFLRVSPRRVVGAFMVTAVLMGNFGTPLVSYATGGSPPPRLTVIKHVVNNDGGTRVASNFTLTVSGSAGNRTVTGSEAGVELTLSPGSYTVAETPITGYTATMSTGCSGTLANGDTKACVVMNDDNPAAPANPRLTVIKHVVNNDGGVRQAGDFTLEVSGSAGNRAVRGSESGLELILAPGSYTVTEPPVAGYRTSTSSGCAGNLANGDVKVCVVTNDDIANPPENPPRLTVIKHVVNNDGGTRVAANFMLTVSGSAGNRTVTGSEIGTELTLTPGNYVVTETLVEGYTVTMSSGCSGTLADGDLKVCIVTNDDRPAPPANPRLTVIKHVVNNDGGVKQAGDFTIRIQGSAGTRSFAGSEAGVVFELQPGTYTVAEDQDSGYLASLSTDCAGTLTVGQTKICAVTNDDKPAPPPSSPSLIITKDVLQSFTNPDTVVSYRIAVRNAGAGIARQVRVEDQLPTGFIHTANSSTAFSWALGDLASGQESVLIYTVRVGASVAAGFYTNTATAAATNHGPVSDTATLEVRTPTVIGESTKPNLVLAKTANVSFVNPGGTVTYHLVLENRGDGVAENVVVNDTLPSGFTAAGTGSAFLTWTVGDLAPGARWEMSFDARTGESIAAGTYRNVAAAKADNHGSVEASADVDVRRGEVLGISTLPATGGNIAAIAALVARVLGSLAAMIAGLVLVVDPSGRLRRRLNPEARLLFLVARARQRGAF